RITYHAPRTTRRIPRILLRTGLGAVAVLIIMAVVNQVGQNAYARYFDQQANLLATWREMYVPELHVGQLLKQYEGQYLFYVVPIYKNLPPQQYIAPQVTQPLDYPGEWAIPLDGPTDRPIAFIIDPPTAGDFARLTRLFPHGQFNILRSPRDPQPL